MKNFLIKSIIFFLIFFPTISFACIECHAEQNINIPSKAISIAKSWAGTIETPPNSNRGKLIDEMHRFYGIPYGNPYCMMTVGYAYHKAYDSFNKKSPIPKIARVSLIYRWSENNPLIVKTFTPKSVMLGAVNLKPGDIILWKSGTKTIKENWNGHAGLTLLPLPNNKIHTIEGNTMPNDKGNQREGGGIWERVRGYGLGTSFEIVSFMRLK